jgi:methylmalonyl-CoA mutase
MKTERLALASGFAPASRQDWHKLVDGVLKGAPFEKLIGRTYDDLRIEPIYLRAKDIALVDGHPRRLGRSCSASIIQTR